jgi:hypothetical protein
MASGILYNRIVRGFGGFYGNKRDINKNRVR